MQDNGCAGIMTDCAPGLAHQSDMLDTGLSMAVTSGAVAGVCAQMVNAHETLYTGAAGMAEPDGVAMIGSMTKLPVTILALQLMQDGYFTLETPVKNILPEIETFTVIEGWDGDTPRLRAPRKTMTIRHLMTHTAGMPYRIWDEDQCRYADYADIPGVTTGGPRALMSALSDDPGNAWTYGIATDWLARLVTSCLGCTIGMALKTRLFEPMGLKDIGYMLTPQMRARLMPMHKRNNDGHLHCTGSIRPQDPPVEEGGGGLYASLSDYAALIKMLLGNGRFNHTPILHPKTVSLMYQNHIAPLEVSCQKTHFPDISADLDFYPDTKKSFGLGLMRLEEQAPNGRPAGTLSWAGIANTYFWIDPIREIGGVWFSQVMPFLDPSTHSAYLAFEGAVYGDHP